MGSHAAGPGGIPGRYPQALCGELGGGRSFVAGAAMLLDVTWVVANVGDVDKIEKQLEDLLKSLGELGEEARPP